LQQSLIAQYEVSLPGRHRSNKLRRSRSDFFRSPELGAVLLGDRLEIGSEIESHAAYLGHWIELLKESPKVLFQVLSEARQAADLICQKADP
jgi:antirestriction protein ArdC